MLDKIRLKLEKIPSEYRRWSAFGVLLALLLALPITIWGLTSGRFEVRKRAATSEVTPTPAPKNPINWKTDQALLQADDFYIVANGQKYLANTGNVRVSSDPGSYVYTTLEAIWWEHGKEMRLFMYFNGDANKWWVSEIRTYNGQERGDWIYYKGPFFESPRGTAFHGVDYLLESDSPDRSGRLHLENFYVQPFFRQLFPSCRRSCTSDSQCDWGLKCGTLPCRLGTPCAQYVACYNPNCPFDSDCICLVPTPTPTPLPRPRCEPSSIKPPSGPAPLTVTLFGGGSAGYTPGIDGYQWDFENDGIWDTGISIEPVTHTYTKTGTYYPKYRVHSVNGQWSEICNYPFPIIVCVGEGQTMPVYPGYQCCPGLAAISTAAPDTKGNCPAHPPLGASVCTKCGLDNQCGLGENKCNCPQDCLPTPTAVPAPATLRLKIKFEGVTSRPADDSDKEVKIYATNLTGGPNLGSVDSRLTIPLKVDDSGVYSMEFSLDGPYFGHHYRLRIKGPKHLQAVFPDVVFQRGQELDLTDKPLRPGDLNTDGKVDLQDLQIINTRIFSANPSDVALADVNFDKRVDIIDRTLVLNTLSVQYDPD